MKVKFLTSIALAASFGLALTSCEDYLDKPTIDNYVADGYYKTDAQCLAGTSYLYSSPWSDFTRNFITVGEVLSGNYYPGTGNAYMDFTLNSSDSELGNMSASLWSVIAHCNTVYNYINGASGPSAAAKNQTLGECLVWKAVAYFFLVRSFGEVPIIHDNTASLGAGDYNSYPKAKKADVYEYIIMTLEKAIDLLPENPMEKGRIDKSAAQGLLAKVYLTKAGVTGAINTADLDKAIDNAKACLYQDWDKQTDIRNKKPQHDLMANYADQFRLANNINPECLISWRWNAKNNQWTDQSFMQSDYATEGFSEFGDIWGGWKGMSTDLQEAFGIKLLEQTPDAWLNNRDSRLHATMMLPGFKYDYFWTDKEGPFDWLKFIYDHEYNPSAYWNATEGRYGMETPTGAAPVKHLWGDGADHQAGAGHSAGRMASSLATPILRLSDVYLVWAEAELLKTNPTNPQAASSTLDDVRNPINEVRRRAGLPELSTVTWDDIWLERRLELAFEGDRWYDFVRVSYYNPEYVMAQLRNQKRNVIFGLDKLYYTYYTTGDWTVEDGMAYDDKTPALGDAALKTQMHKDVDSGKLYFAIPMTTQDIIFNGNLAAPKDENNQFIDNGEHVDVRGLYKY